MGLCVWCGASDCESPTSVIATGVRALTDNCDREARLRRKRRGAGFSVRTEREFRQKPILTDALDLNLPVTGVAFTLVFFFLSVKTPEGSITAKLKRVDWV